MKRPDRLGVADTALLMFDSADAPFAFVACMRLDGEVMLDEHGRVRLDHVRTMARANMYKNPRNRQVPLEVPLGLGRPVWVDSPTFDVDDHFSAETLPEPSEAALVDRIVAYMQEPFAPGRPLWHNLLLDGLPDGNVALLVKVHHCMMDGVGGLSAFEGQISLTPELVPPAPPAPWTPTPPPTSARLVLHALHDQIAHLGYLGRTAVRALRAPRASWRRARRILRNARRDAQAYSDMADIGLKQPAGPRRAVSLGARSLDHLKTVRAAYGCTVNDVLVAMAAGATWQLLQGRGEVTPGAELTIACPVSTRSSEHSALDNHMSYMTVTVPLADAEPATRLRDVQVATETAKASGSPQDLQRLIDLAQFAVPAMLERQVERADRRGTPLGVSNVVGPPVPVWLMGARIVSFHGIAPLPLYGGIAVVCVSFDGTVGIGITADPDVVPDPDSFLAAMHDELERMLEAAEVTAP